MGSRAHYVVKENGSWDRRYSQWGAHSLELDLLPGPDPAIRFARAQRADDRWMYEPDCEGAALIDRDENRLLWYSYCHGDADHRAAVLAVMAHTWQGWRVRWAHGGLGDILDALGEPRRAAPPLESPFGTPDPEQAATSAREVPVGAAQGSDVARGLPGLIERFEAHQEVDAATQAISLLLAVTGALTAAAERSGMTTRTTVDNAFAHRPVDLTDDERAPVNAAFAAVRRECGLAG